MRLRIVKMVKYETLYELQRERWYGWEQLMWGGLEDCKAAIKNIKEHGVLAPVVYQETI